MKNIKLCSEKELICHVERISPDKNRDKHIYLSLYFFITCSFFMIFFQNSCVEAKANTYSKVGKEAAWKCSGCYQRVWVKYPDMWGNYYCPACGTEKK